MKEPIWVLDEVALAIHSMLLAEHGGGNGVRDSSMLDSALARPRQKKNYEPKSSIFELAAAYSLGIAKNHPFVDGNKRTAFTIGTLFLEMNGYILNAPEVDVVITFESLAAGEVSESELAEWFKENCKKA
ncbi:MAG: type II toxin-antitoxin system death-on-curing family toxin [Methylophaga sp.]|nr:MAG: type II toxin-antitoxin system death-on-curing family toxin [Methylophaga sp.]